MFEWGFLTGIQAKRTGAAHGGTGRKGKKLGLPMGWEGGISHADLVVGGEIEVKRGEKENLLGESRETSRGRARPGIVWGGKKIEYS